VGHIALACDKLDVLSMHLAFWQVLKIKPLFIIVSIIYFCFIRKGIV